MFAALGAFAARRRRLVLLLALAFLLVGGAWGAGAPGSLSGGGGFDDPGSESSHADTLLAGQLGRQVTDVVAVYHSDTATVDDPAFAQAVRTAAARVPRTTVTRLETFWSTGSAAFVSADRHSTYVGVQLASADDQTRVTQFKAIQGSFAAPGLTVRFGGMTPMTQQVNQQVGQDIARAELLSVPVLLMLLVVIFGSAVAAGLPLVIGILAAVGSLAVVRGVTLVTDLSTFAINVVSILGLGLAIDYSLLLVNRFREELAAGRSADDAVRRTVATAGRTVAFSGVTVAISLLGLVVFPSKFLQSMGWAGASTVLFAALSSITVLPALLRVLGPRVNALRVRRLRPAGDVSRGRWYRVAHGVMRRPVASTVGIVVVLVFLGSPFFGVNWARPGDWVLPVGADARAVTQIMAGQFPADPAKIVTGVVEFPGAVDSAQARDFARRLAEVPGVTSSAVTGTSGDLARISLGYKADPMSVAASDMIHGIRAVAAPPGARASFTGMPASRVDIVRMIGSGLPWMALFVALVSFVVLFLAFGSVVLPLKSLLMNLLSLSASFGAIKLIFQDGWLSGVLNFVPVGAVDVDFPVLVIAIAFGLSMDYEVFLLSRVREEWVRTGDTTESVAVGLQRTARIITSAALLLVVVVGGFLISGITFMKMLGVGLIIAVLVDATVVRGLLVPATMRLLGKWAWWSPAPLARWWNRHGLPDVDEEAVFPVRHERELIG
ncbi:MMPL family transporter [Kutzneria sp. NPDC052558]|uniref:MMPL family transporter n=1 Tax=Kutzneria sp. NPDC052558 TaxID=3364121 RepID=UPI0037CAB537